MEIDGKSPLLDLSTRLSGLDNLDQPARKMLKAGQESVRLNSDRVELSVRSQELQHLDEIIQSIPDVREAKVEQLRLAVQSGTYNVRAEQVADKILSGTLIDEIY